jgi:hypothetical protein
MKDSEHKQILKELNDFINKLEEIDEKNGKADLNRDNFLKLIQTLESAYVEFEYRDLFVEDDE